MEGAAELCFVFRVTLEVAEFAHTVRKLALVTIFADAGFLERAAELGLVAAGGRRRGRGLAGGALQAAVAEPV